MFLPNTDSFLLRRRPIRRSIVKLCFPVFLPNTYSFLLRRGPLVEPEFTPTPVLEETGVGLPQSTDGEQPKVTDQGKRNFLKVAGVVGASVIVSQLSPQKAEALIMGSSPTTGVVGVKNSTNARINPATQETVSTLATEATAATLLKTEHLSLNAGVLDVKVTSVSGAGSSSFSNSADVATSGRVDDSTRHVYVDVKDSVLPTAASTETTLSKIALGGVQYALRMATDSVDSNLEYVGEAQAGTLPGATSGWRIKRINSTSGIVIEWAQVGGVGTEGFSFEWDERQNYTYS